MMPKNMKAVRAVLKIEAEEPISDYTGRLVKQFIYTINKEIRIFHSMRGSVAPVMISPLFTLGRKDMELGTVVSPQYIRKPNNDTDSKYVLVPVKLDGEYIIHIGGDSYLVESITKSIEKLKAPLAIKFNDTIVTIKTEKIEDVTTLIASKSLDSDKVTLYMKSPALIFNVFSASRLPKFSPSAVEILMTPFLYVFNYMTLDSRALLEASRYLGLLVETYYSLNTLNPIMIPFKGKREVALTGKITYILDAKNESTKEDIEKILKASEIVGIGESRLNGFGTTTWKQK